MLTKHQKRVVAQFVKIGLRQELRLLANGDTEGAADMRAQTLAFIACQSAPAHDPWTSSQFRDAPEGFNEPK